MSVRVGLLDSGLGPEHRPLAAVFVPGDGRALKAARPDRTGHGTDMARIVLGFVPQAELLLAQVFETHLTSTPDRVAAGLDWCVEREADVALMCLGLRRDTEMLRTACERALAAGLDLVAAAPPRGRAVFPASYPGVISVCGDARCGNGEISALGGTPADFGACHVFTPSGRRGASCAAAAVCGLVAAWRARGGTGDAAEYLRSIARFAGRERRSGTGFSASTAAPKD